jgi:hypothetical protein
MKRDELEHVLRASAAITAAGRDKDAQWVASLLRHRLIELPRLLQRIEALATAGVQTDRLVAWARRRGQEAQT